MDKQLLIYVYTALLTFVGLLCLFAAFRKMTAKEKMTKALDRPPIRNYGNPFPFSSPRLKRGLVVEQFARFSLLFSLKTGRPKVGPFPCMLTMLKFVLAQQQYKKRNRKRLALII